jgi:hypothetical protein
MKRLLAFLLVFIVFLLLLSKAMASDSPRIENFSIIQNGDNVEVIFDFRNVSGGLPSASFTMGFQVLRDNGMVDEGMVVEQKIITESGRKVTVQYAGDKSKENGSFKAIIPQWSIKGLESGDKVRYFILLVDGEEKYSNIAVCEFAFVRQWGL